MITIPLQRIRAAAPHRAAGYYEACLAAGRVEGEMLLLSEAAYGDLRARFSPAQSAQPAQSAPSPALPGLGQMARNFAGAVAAEAWAMAQGREPVPPEEKARRLMICEGCEFFRPAERRCAKCGCKMDIKAGWRASRCPAGKW